MVPLAANICVKLGYPGSVARSIKYPFPTSKGPVFFSSIRTSFVDKGLLQPRRRLGSGKPGSEKCISTSQLSGVWQSLQIRRIVRSGLGYSGFCRQRRSTPIYSTRQKPLPPQRLPNVPNAVPPTPQTPASPWTPGTPTAPATPSTPSTPRNPLATTSPATARTPPAIRSL